MDIKINFQKPKLQSQRSTIVFDWNLHGTGVIPLMLISNYCLYLLM